MHQKILSLLISMLLLLTITKGLAADPDVYFKCNGFDPTWSMTITNKSIDFKLLSGESVSMPTVRPLNALGYPEDYALIYYTHDKQKPDQRIVIALTTNMQGCRDKVTGKKTPYDALVLFPKLIYVGCCDSNI